jgi:hypothetical protein
MYFMDMSGYTGAYNSDTHIGAGQRGQVLAGLELSGNTGPRSAWAVVTRDGHTHPHTQLLGMLKQNQPVSHVANSNIPASQPATSSPGLMTLILQLVF